jgi:acyl-CoA thioesterase FadM
MDGRKWYYASSSFSEYIKPARYDDLLTVKTIFKSQSTVKIEFDYEIYNEQRELLTIASSIWFCEYENRSSDRS